MSGVCVRGVVLWWGKVVAGAEDAMQAEAAVESLSWMAEYSFFLNRKLLQPQG